MTIIVLTILVRARVAQNRYRRERGKELRCPEHWRTRDWAFLQHERLHGPSYVA